MHTNRMRKDAEREVLLRRRVQVPPSRGLPVHHPDLGCRIRLLNLAV